MQNTTVDESAKDIDVENKEQDIESNNNEQEEKPKEENRDEKPSRFTEGQSLSLVRVRFPGNSKSFPFLIGKRIFSYGQKVMAMSDRGMTVGYINSFPYEKKFNKSMMPLKSIAHVASADDIKEQLENSYKERKAEALCIGLIDRHKLNMNLTHIEFIQYGKKAVFYFTAPDRVDFRNLVKDLVGELKMRIELRQISVRDRAAAIGAIGACGLQTCCSSFLSGYGTVSIKMAKNQNLALIPTKINGVCGQLKCCIKFEDLVYTDKRKNLPTEGSFIQAKNGDRGKVLRLHLIIEQFEMLTDAGLKRRYTADQYDSEIKPPKEWKFPQTFQHIVNETSTIIGLKEEVISNDDDFWQRNDLFPDDDVKDLSDTEDSKENNESENPTVEQQDPIDKKEEEVKAKPKRNNRNRNRNKNRNKNKGNSSTENKSDTGNNQPK